MNACKLCGEPVLARQMCSLHYNRWWRHGDPFVTHRGKAAERTFIVIYRKDAKLRARVLKRWSRHKLPTKFKHSESWEIIAVGLQGEELKFLPK